MSRFLNELTRPEGDLAYRILDGALMCFPLPPGGVLPPELRDVERSADNFGRMHPGSENPTFWARTLPRLREISARCTPGVTWWCAPRLDFQPADYLGYSWGRDPVIQVATWRSTRETVSTAYHEAAHSCEHLCTGAEWRAWSDAAHSTEEWGHDYDDRPAERMMNLFEAAAMFAASGGDLILHPGAPANAVFGALYTGEIGRRRIHRQPVCVPAAPAKSSFSSRLVDALGLRPFADWLGNPTEA